MDIKELGAKLKALNEVAVSAVENEDSVLWQEANNMSIALNEEIDADDAELTVEWSTSYSHYILKFD